MNGNKDLSDSRKLGFIESSITQCKIYSLQYATQLWSKDSVACVTGPGIFGGIICREMDYILFTICSSVLRRDRLIFIN